MFLTRALMPLHKPKCVAMYHQQLAYCVTQVRTSRHMVMPAGFLSPPLMGFSGMPAFLHFGGTTVMQETHSYTVRMISRLF
jgi:hypothetical protein